MLFEQEACEAAGFEGDDEGKKEVTENIRCLLGWANSVDYVLNKGKSLRGGVLESVKSGCEETAYCFRCLGY